MLIDCAWAQEPAGAGSGGGPQFGNLLLLWAPILLIFYFIMIRPAQKKQRKRREMLNNLKKGDKVISTGGLIGTVVSTSEKTVVVKIADNVKVKLLRSAVVGLAESDN